MRRAGTPANQPWLLRTPRPGREVLPCVSIRTGLMPRRSPARLRTTLFFTLCAASRVHCRAPSDPLPLSGVCARAAHLHCPHRFSCKPSCAASLHALPIWGKYTGAILPAAALSAISRLAPGPLFSAAGRCAPCSRISSEHLPPAQLSLFLFLAGVCAVYFAALSLTFTSARG